MEGGVAWPARLAVHMCGDHRMATGGTGDEGAAPGEEAAHDRHCERRVGGGAAGREGGAAGGEWIGKSIPQIKIYKNQPPFTFLRNEGIPSFERWKNKMLRGIEPHPL